MLNRFVNKKLYCDKYLTLYNGPFRELQMLLYNKTQSNNNKTAKPPTFNIYLQRDFY